MTPEFVDVVCTAPEHKTPLRRYRFKKDERGWRWMKQFNQDQGPYDPSTGVSEWYGQLEVADYWETSEGVSLKLDCVCGLHLPIDWVRLQDYLEKARHASQQQIPLAALVAIVTRTHLR